MFHSINQYNFPKNDNLLDSADYYTYNNKVKSATVKFTSIDFDYDQHKNSNNSNSVINSNYLIESNYPYFSSNLINGNSTIESAHVNGTDTLKKDKNQKKKLKELKLKSKSNVKSKSKDEMKKRNSLESRAYLSSNTLTSSGDDSDENHENDGIDKQKLDLKKKNTKKENTIYTAVQNVLLPSIIKGSMKQTITNDATASSTESSKCNTIEKTPTSKKKSMKTLKDNFSLRKLATKITNGAGVLKERLNNKRNSNVNKEVPTRTSVFYSDIMLSINTNNENLNLNEKPEDKQRSAFSSDSENNDDLNSALSITNCNFSEKSSLNLNECIVENNVNDDTELYYSQHDTFDFWFGEEQSDEKNDQSAVKNVDKIDEKIDFEKTISVRLK